MELLGELNEIMHVRHLTLLEALRECSKNVRETSCLYIL